MQIDKLFDENLLAKAATGRDVSFCEADTRANIDKYNAAFKGARILVIGGAGSIGSACVRRLVDFIPLRLDIVDSNENALAELARDLRNSDLRLPDQLRFWPIDFGSSTMRAVLEVEDPYDCILNFAALKHVRSEKDVWSVRAMVDTNVLKQLDLIDAIGAKPPQRYFSVSTDKAANPVNIMGASKRLMEIAMFSALSSDTITTSARFANVAFSAGSLLDSMRLRLLKRQPIAVPAGILRFLISRQEAAEICLLAAAVAPNRSTVIPRAGLIELELLKDVVTRVLSLLDLTPSFFSPSETTPVGEEIGRDGSYPIVMTEPDTMGEKLFEEFVGSDDLRVEMPFAAMQGIVPRETLDSANLKSIADLRCAIRSNVVGSTKEGIVAMLRSIMPSFHHVDSKQSLDQRR